MEAHRWLKRLKNEHDIALTFLREASQYQDPKRRKRLVHCASSSSWPLIEYSRGFTMGFAYWRAYPLEFFTLWCRQFTARKSRGRLFNINHLNLVFNLVSVAAVCDRRGRSRIVIAGSGCSLIPIILLDGAYSSEHLHRSCPWVSNLYNYPIISDLFAIDLGDFSIVDVILSSQCLCEQNSCFHC